MSGSWGPSDDRAPVVIRFVPERAPMTFTRGGATALQEGMRTQRITMAVVADPEEGTFQVTVLFHTDGYEHLLGTYQSEAEAGQRMRSWVEQRGLRFAPDSAKRLDRAQQEDLNVLVLDVIPESR